MFGLSIQNVPMIISHHQANHFHDCLISEMNYPMNIPLEPSSNHYPFHRERYSNESSSNHPLNDQPLNMIQSYPLYNIIS